MCKYINRISFVYQTEWQQKCRCSHLTIHGAAFPQRQQYQQMSLDDLFFYHIYTFLIIGRIQIIGLEKCSVPPPPFQLSPFFRFVSIHWAGLSILSRKFHTNDELNQMIFAKDKAVENAPFTIRTILARDFVSFYRECYLAAKIRTGSFLSNQIKLDSKKANKRCGSTVTLCLSRNLHERLC